MRNIKGQENRYSKVQIHNNYSKNSLFEKVLFQLNLQVVCIGSVSPVRPTLEELNTKCIVQFSLDQQILAGELVNQINSMFSFGGRTFNNIMSTLALE